MKKWIINSYKKDIRAAAKWIHEMGYDVRLTYRILPDGNSIYIFIDNDFLSLAFSHNIVDTLREVLINLDVLKSFLSIDKRKKL